jgi:hypothetical protein
MTPQGAVDLELSWIVSPINRSHNKSFSSAREVGELERPLNLCLDTLCQRFHFQNLNPKESRYS